MQPLKILFIPFEFVAWQYGRAWTYELLYGWEEGLRAFGVDLTTIPGVYELPSSEPASWLFHVRSLLVNQKFDQVWILYPHTKIGDEILEWLAEIAPVRVGIIMESLHYLPEEISDAPVVTVYRSFIENQARFLTHIACCDEFDAEYFKARGKISATWCPWAIPQRFLEMKYPKKSNSQAAFYGAMYGKREKFLTCYELSNILVKPKPPEEETDLPQLFDENGTANYARLYSGFVPSLEDLSGYLSLTRRIRENIFVRWLKDIAKWSAHVSLPTRFKGFSNRVLEAGVAGVPVIHWDVPNRPKSRDLFEDGSDILYFDGDEPEIVAEKIRQIQTDSELAEKLMNNLRSKIQEFHTTEYRVSQLQKWIQTGNELKF